MPNFEFNARDANGGAQTGVLDGNSAAAIVDQLRGRGWMVTSVKEKTGGSADLLKINSIPFLGPRAVHIELSLRQLAVMLRGGLTLLSSLQTLVEQSPSRATRQMWQKVIDVIQEGATFSDAVQKHSSVPEYVVRLVRVGEQTGILESVLVRAASMMQARREIIRNIATAMAYPMIVLISAGGATAYMIGYLIPKLGRLLQSMGKPLPRMTQILIDIAQFVQSYGLMIVAGIVIAAVGFFVIYSWPPGRAAVDRFALWIPIFGRVFRVSGTVTFSRSMSTLVHSGVSMLDALVTVQQMHYNRFQANCVQSVREAVMQGRSLADSLRAFRAYTPLLATMAAVGEETGSLDEVMDETAQFHESQLDALIKTFAAWVTPAVILLVGGIVGFVYIAFFLALFAVA